MDGLLAECFSPWAASPGDTWALVSWVWAVTCAGPGQRARMLHREQTVRRGSCESWQKLSWSCIKARHVPYLGFVTTLTEVPGAGQSWLLAAPAQGTCWAGRAYRHGAFHSQGLAHAAITSVTHWEPPGQRWTQPLLPAEPFLEGRAGQPGWGHGCSLEGGERPERRGVWTGRREQDKPAPWGRGWGWYAAVVSCITRQDLPHAGGRSSFLWLKRLGGGFAGP